MSKQSVPDDKKPAHVSKKPKVTARSQPAPSPAQRATLPADPITPAQALPLQRTLGNRAVGTLISNRRWNIGQSPIPNPQSPISVQRKMTLNAVGDQYEQEADAVAKEVVGRINSPDFQAAQRQEEDEEGLMAQRVQRQEMDEEEAMVMPARLQRQELENEELMAQRQEVEEDEELAMASRVQRQEEDEELMAQRPEDEEELMAQRQDQLVAAASESQTAEAVTTNQDLRDGGPIAPDIESRIEQARGGGQPLDDDVRRPMEQAFGADFSAVRIHTGIEADELNQTLGAHAFTTGKEIFFRSTKPRSNHTFDQALLAHELTHVVQQTNSLHRRDELTFEEGSTIEAQQDFDYETKREMRIDTNMKRAIERAKLYLLTHRMKINEAIDDFKSSAREQIESLESEPSEYWNLFPILSGTVASTLGILFPPTAIIGAILVGTASAAQLAVTNKITEERISAKQQAQKVTELIAQQEKDSTAKAFNSASKYIWQHLFNLSLTDEQTRVLLDFGYLDNVIELLGIPDPEKISFYAVIRERLEVKFAEWITRQQLNQGRTEFEQMLGELRGTKLYWEDMKKIEAARGAAQTRTYDSAKRRGEPGYM